MNATFNLLDFGTLLIATFVDSDGAPINISTATLKQLVFEPPCGIAVEKDADFSTDGADGKIQWAVEEGFLDEAGLWKVQGIMGVGGGGLWHSNIHTFRVRENLT